MNWIEIIHLRSYSQPERNKALAAFQQLSLPARENGLKDVILLRDVVLDNDLCIFIYWASELSGKGKSPLGLQLAAAFSEFGQINHSVWMHAGTAPLKARRTHDEKQR